MEFEMAGRRPKPTALKELEGNPGKRPLNKHEPKPRGLPACPTDNLSPLAQIEWRRVCRELHRCGLLTTVDRAALSIYCANWARWTEAEDNVRKFGEVIKSPKGYPIQNPYLSIANRAEELMLKTSIEFGMTPASRSKVSSQPLPDGDDESEAESYFSPRHGNGVLQ
jgi:P27 family predicted phage terminase small subunit